VSQMYSNSSGLVFVLWTTWVSRVAGTYNIGASGCLRDSVYGFGGRFLNKEIVEWSY